MSASSPISLLSPSEEEHTPLFDAKNSTENVEKENKAPSFQLPDFVYSVTATKEYPFYIQDTPDVFCVGTYLDLEDARNAAWDQMSDRSYPGINEESSGGDIWLEREPGRHDCGTTVRIEAVTVHKPGSVPRSRKRPQPKGKKAGKRTGKSSAGVKKDTPPGKKQKKGKRKEWELLAD